MQAGMLLLLGTVAGGPPSAGPLPVPGMGAMPPHAMMAPYQHAGMMPAPAPLLAARVLAPQGVRVAVHPGSPLAKFIDASAVLGLRPGYVYRIELSNLPYYPNQVLYPEIEVRGTLVPNPSLKYMEWPAPLLFTQGDIERALLGAVITKAIYLEDPEKAIPAEFGLNAPVELPAGSEDEAVKEALAAGRLVAIVRLGNKRPPAEWLKASAIDGTILIPGENYLKSPAVPPTIPFYAARLFDPILGPKGAKEECILDGGDRGDPLGIGPHGRIGGLNPTDVGVEYTVSGKRKVATSNAVGLCVPRFAIHRSEIAPGAYDVPVGIKGTIGGFAAQGIRDRAAAMAEIGREKPVGVEARQRPMAYIGAVGTSFYIGSNRPAIVGQVDGIAVTGAVVEPEVITAYPGAAPLTVTKSVDASGPLESGKEVTFTIRYLNTGNRPITDVAVSDSLGGRLEYVVGSNQSDRAANFSAAANEVGSTVVRWELPGTILPGHGGTVKFKAKVR